MDLCSRAAPALMESGRASQEEWKKRRVEEKVKQRRRRGWRVSTASCIFSFYTFTPPPTKKNKHVEVHKNLHTHTNRTSREGQQKTPDRIRKGLEI